MTGPVSMPEGAVIMVPVVPEMFAQLADGWSPPVRVKIEPDGRGWWQMVAQTHTCPDLAPADVSPDPGRE